MRKILTLLCVCLFALPVSAQFDDIQWGVVGGLNYAVLVGEDAEDAKEDIEDALDDIKDLEGDYKRWIYGKLGFHLGVIGEYELKENLSIVSGLQYSQKGYIGKVEYKYGYGNMINPQYGFIYSSEEFEHKARFILNYLDLPITVKYNLDNRFSVFGGLLFSFLISEKVKWEMEQKAEYDDGYGNIITDINSDSDTNDNFDHFFSQFTTKNIDDPKGTLSGYQIGVGYEFDAFNVSLKLNKNSNAFESDYGDDNQNITYQLSVSRYF